MNTRMKYGAVLLYLKHTAGPRNNNYTIFKGRSRDCKGPLEAVIINLSGYDVRRKKLKDTKINSRIR